MSVPVLNLQILLPNCSLSAFTSVWNGVSVTDAAIHRVPYVCWIAVLAFPGFLMKQVAPPLCLTDGRYRVSQVINLFQLKNAMIGLVRHELRSRAENHKLH